MTTVLVVVTEIRAHEPHEVPLAKDDDVFKNLASTISDPAFCRSILPRASIRGANGTYPERLTNRTTAGLKIESRSSIK